MFERHALQHMANPAGFIRPNIIVSGGEEGETSGASYMVWFILSLKGKLYQKGEWGAFRNVPLF